MVLVISLGSVLRKDPGNNVGYYGNAGGCGKLKRIAYMLVIVVVASALLELVYYAI